MKLWSRFKNSSVFCFVRLKIRTSFRSKPKLWNRVKTQASFSVSWYLIFLFCFYNFTSFFLIHQAKSIYNYKFCSVFVTHEVMFTYFQLLLRIWSSEKYMLVFRCSLIVIEKISGPGFAVYMSLFMIGGWVELCTFSIQGRGWTIMRLWLILLML